MITFKLEISLSGTMEEKYKEWHRDARSDLASLVTGEVPFSDIVAEDMAEGIASDLANFADQILPGITYTEAMEGIEVKVIE